MEADFAALRNVYKGSYCTMAGLALFVHDYLLTLPSEIRLVWPTSWSIGTVLYYTARYPAFVDGVLNILVSNAPSTYSPETCMLLKRAAAVFSSFGLIQSTVVLAFRTWVLWGAKKQAGIAIFLTFACLCIPTAYFTYRSFFSFNYTPSPFEDLVTCWPAGNGVAKQVYLAYVCIMVFETLVFVLTIYRSRWYLKHTKSRIVSTLFRDGVFYYLSLLVVSIGNVVVLGANVPGVSLIYIQRVFHSIFTARILLNLRKSASVAEIISGRELSTIIIDQWYGGLDYLHWSVGGDPGGHSMVDGIDE